jgi:N6-L-threonylcarbamoyladenine synthase
MFFIKQAALLIDHCIYFFDKIIVASFLTIMTRTLAIETSCDDTSLAIVSYDGDVFTCEQMKAYSQIDDHQKYGGVVPEIASRQHSEKIIAVYNSLSLDRDTIDCISVTTEPGLP